MICLGNFTQIVWKNSKKVGFGFSLTEDGYFYAVANYYPAGNTLNQLLQLIINKIIQMTENLILIKVITGINLVQMCFQ